MEVLLEKAEEGTIWEGTTWEFCLVAPCLSPLLCSQYTWSVTIANIDLQHGCGATEYDVIELWQIIDIQYSSNFWQRCLHRGTIAIHSTHKQLPDITLTTYGAERIFNDLYEAWDNTMAQQAQAAAADMSQ